MKDPAKLTPSELYENIIWDETIYKEGSDTCRNYSRLTESIRRTALYTLMVLCIGTAITILKLPETIAPKEPPQKEIIGIILTAFGIAMWVFSLTMALIDWHYQSAFTAIRDVLAAMEHKYIHKEKNKMGMMGIWTAHYRIRTQEKDFIASYSPFIALCLFAIVCLLIAYWLLAYQIAIPFLMAGFAISSFCIFYFMIYKNQGCWLHEHFIEESKK